MKGNRGTGNENSEDEFEGVGTGAPFPADKYEQSGLYLEIVRPR
jgi:hypothetical protein